MRRQLSRIYRIDVKLHIEIMNQYYTRDKQRWVLERSVVYRSSDIYDHPSQIVMHRSSDIYDASQIVMPVLFYIQRHA